MKRRRRKVKVGRSKIDGYGVVATHVIERGEVINTKAIRRLRKFGGFNHSCRPNVVLARLEDGDQLVVATRRIARGEELTTFYYTWRRKSRQDDVPPRDCRPCQCPLHKRKR